MLLHPTQMLQHLFVCRRCTRGPQNKQDAAVQRNDFDIGMILISEYRNILKIVGKFCYLGDMF